jgi:hypothetical protein
MTRTLTVLTALLAVIAPATAMAATGTVQACRKAGIVSLTDGKAIALPVGSVFADLSDARDRNPSGDSYRPVRLRLLQPLGIAASARCGSAQAEVSVNSKAFRIGPGEHRVYGISGAFSGPIPEVAVYVTDDFR